mmetsp:Transcript_3943/g.8698  ORF Transcript_3943/g.8698 Transcript_3943/m.8698 type:complete len:753 (+) Transcript_3943:855-3113(+)
MPEALVVRGLQLEIKTSEFATTFCSRRGTRINQRPRPGNPATTINIPVIINDNIPSLGHHESAGDAVRLNQISGDVRGTTWHSTIARQQPHLRSRDADEIIQTSLIGDLHDIISDIVHDLDETEHLHASNSRRVLEDISSMITIVKIIIGMSHSELRSLHTSRIATNNKVRSTSGAARFGVELDLRGAGVDHGRGPNSHDSGVRVKSSRVVKTRVEYFLMLLHPHIKWHIVFLCPSSQRTQPEHRLLVSLLLQVLSGTLHEVGMSSVGRISRLESVHGIGALFLELIHDFSGSLTPLIKSIVVADAIEELDLSSNEVVSALVDLLDVRVTRIDDTEHSGDNLFLAVGVNFGVSEDGDDVAHLGGQCNSVLSRRLNGRLGILGTTEGDRNTHGNAIGGTMGLKIGKVGRASVNALILCQVERINKDGIEMQHFQKGSLPHESLEGSGPSLSDHLKPVEIQIGDEHLRQALGLLLSGSLQMFRHVQVDHLISIGVGESRWGYLRRTLQNTIHLQSSEQNIRGLFNLQLVRLQRNLRIGGRLVRIINARKVLELPALHARVLSLGIALLQLVHGNVQENFVKGNALILVTLAHGVAITAVGGDESHEGDDAGVGEEGGDLARAADGFGAIGLAEGEVAVDPGAEVVPVEAVDVLSVGLDETILERGGDGGLAGAGASCHPEGGTLLLEGGVAGFGGEVAGGLRFSGGGGGAFDDVGRSGVEGLGAKGAEVDGGGVDFAIAIAGGVGDGGGGGGGS